MKPLLTDEEMRVICYGDEYKDNVTCEIPPSVQYSAKAQLKKVVEWGQEKCVYHYWNDHTPYRHLIHRRCPECWQALLKEVE